jgi:hypothetical protein
VKTNVDQLLSGPAVRKLLFMAPPVQVEGLLKPHWSSALVGSGAEVMQAVPNMLEVVPSGINKWGGLQVRGMWCCTLVLFHAIFTMARLCCCSSISLVPDRVALEGLTCVPRTV